MVYGRYDALVTVMGFIKNYGSWLLWLLTFSNISYWQVLSSVDYYWLLLTAIVVIIECVLTIID
jgi:hypothetical protein